uniref:ICA69 domain-containing protein n=1 Tax=Steinernema glaseri TaxID=37863 RepID=A0A1I7XZH2_9BILA
NLLLPSSSDSSNLHGSSKFRPLWGSSEADDSSSGIDDVT